MRWIALVSLLAGCDYLFNLDHVTASGEDVDANVGMTIDGGPCVDGAPYGMTGGKGLLQVCVPDARPSMLALTTNISTNTDCDTVLPIDSINTQVCVKWATSVTIEGGVQTRGDRPLVVVATESILVRGVVDLASRHGGTPGAGNNWIGCNTLNGSASQTGGGGGPGGSFGTKGGNGAAGGGGTARPARLAQPIDRVRGGCAGGIGGTGTAGVSGGDGGPGGGALYLIAGTSIAIEETATINVSGAGGDGGAGALGTTGAGGGGGGGGSGGLVGLDAPTVMIDPSARLLANGGGGGAGGGADGAMGAGGSDPSATSITTGASGGIGPSAGGQGAAGVVDAKPGATQKSGGGGGGGAGYIVISSSAPFLCAQCSPLAMPAP